ncbi:glycosyltransferase family 4 protein [Novosphingobium sp. SG720]|uniref:glycosyltransferase n=1 Tax=Novosphingobium sp. SG720 TaxID=2586998 RepID=UPI001446406B|nr:glycosyltransferase involved in cell wall biosynthesis [Novosphingobium sp. SG720]
MKPSMILVWHEAGNKLYHDRFRELGKLFDLTVLGPQVFAGKEYAEVTEPEFTLKLFPSIAPGHWLTYVSPGMLSYIRAHPPQVLYIHEEPHSLTAFLAALLKRKSTFVLESSAINLKGNFSGANVMERVVHARADIVFPKNTEVAGVLRARGAKAERIVAPLGNGVSLESFSPIPKDEARAKLTALFPQGARAFDGRVLAGYAGRIWRPKGLEYFSRAAHQAGAALLLCGPVSDPDVAEAVQQFGGVLLPALNKEQLPIFYSALDLFVLPSVPTPNWREQFGRVCAEAVFCGTPALGSNVGGIPGVVGPNAIFEPGDEASLATRIGALQDPAARAALLTAQIAHINDNFSWASIAARVQRETARF